MPPTENTNTDKISGSTDGGAGMGLPKNNKLMAVFSYLGILVFIPFFLSRNDPYVKFHIKQGFVLFGIELICMIFGSMAYSLWFLFQIVNFGVLILSIFGIINALKGREKELPLVGSLAKHFKF